MNPLAISKKAARGAVVSFIAAAFLALAGAAAAQDAAQAEAGLAVWKRGGCSNCHGTFGEGGAGGKYPAGPNLRSSRLDRDLLVETIACGLPGTQMPFNAVGAFQEYPCFGIPAAEPPVGAQRGRALTAEDIEALAAYLLARVVGQGGITREECGLYYGDPNRFACNAFE